MSKGRNNNNSVKRKSSKKGRKNLDDFEKYLSNKNGNNKENKPFGGEINKNNNFE
jgi:hypothetical protein